MPPRSKAKSKQPTEEEEVEALYKHFEVLADVASVEEAEKYSDAYKAVIKASSGHPKGKSLSAQFIPKFLHFFPKLADEAINGLLDLCEDEDVSIRVNAIRGLPTLCQNSPEHLGKMADVLGQLLVTDENIEMENVKKAFVQLFRINGAASLVGLFTHIHTGEDALREASIHFFQDKILPSRRDLLGDDEAAERHLADVVRKAMLATPSDDEFEMFLQVLTSLKLYKRADMLRELVDVVSKRAGINIKDTDVAPTDSTALDKVISSISLMKPLLRRGAQAPQLVTFLGGSVLGNFGEIPDTHKVAVLKALADVSPYGNADAARAVLPTVYAAMIAFIPRKPTEAQESPRINFTFIECLLITFHHLAGFAPGFLHGLCGIKIVTGQPSDTVMLDAEEIEAKLVDFKDRLAYLSTSSQLYGTQIDQAVKKINTDISELEGKKRKVIFELKKARRLAVKQAKAMEKEKKEEGEGKGEGKGKEETVGTAVVDAEGNVEVEPTKEKEEEEEKEGEGDVEAMEVEGEGEGEGEKKEETPQEKEIKEIKDKIAALTTKRTPLQTALRTTNNVKHLATLLFSKSPRFINIAVTGTGSTGSFVPSWHAAPKKRSAPTQGGKSGGGDGNPAKKAKTAQGQGQGQNQGKGKGKGKVELKQQQQKPQGGQQGQVQGGQPLSMKWRGGRGGGRGRGGRGRGRGRGGFRNKF